MELFGQKYALTSLWSWSRNLLVCLSINGCILTRSVLSQELDEAEDEKQESSILLPSGYNSRVEVQAALTKVSAALRKAKGQPAEVKPVDEDMIPMSEKYPLLEVPNSLLTADQVRQLKAKLGYIVRQILWAFLA